MKNSAINNILKEQTINDKKLEINDKNQMICNVLKDSTINKKKY